MCKMTFFMTTSKVIDKIYKPVLFCLFCSLLFFHASAYCSEYNERNGDKSTNPVTEIGINTAQNTVSIDSALTLSLMFKPGSGLDKPMDLWLLGFSNGTLYYFDFVTMRFLPGLYPTYQGYIPELNQVALPVMFEEAGQYDIYFAVDTIANGQLDFDIGELFYSKIALPLTVEVKRGSLVTYMYNGELYRISAVNGASPENISARLNLISSGNDDSINVSPNGQWYLISSERFHNDCVGWECLTLLNSTLSTHEVVISNGSVVHGGVGAVSSTGDDIVYTSGDGTHVRDLWYISRQSINWSTPLQITGASPFQYNNVPSISAEGDKVIFECGDEPYANKSICEVNLDGSGFRTIFRPDTQYRAARTPDYAPDGTIVAELDSVQYGESIFRIDSDTGKITPINLNFTNDNSPCVLGNGSIVSLWMNREGGNGIHEIKIMDSNGYKYFMLLNNIDVIDEILGCASW